MPRLLQVVQLGNPILRREADEVRNANVNTAVIQELIDDMLATCEESGGVGIAAPQVGLSVRIIIVASKPTPAYPRAPTIKPVAMINPKITMKSENLETGWEGCMSIPGLRGNAGRHKTIKLSYLTRFGAPITDEAWGGFLARVAQHEVDHLDGIMFTDRTHPLELISEKEYQKLVASWISVAK